jgi:uncharacterized membrane protein
MEFDSPLILVVILAVVGIGCGYERQTKGYRR